MSLPLACFVAAIGLGLVVETTAGLLRLWTYRTPLLILANIVLAFGLIQGFGVGWVIGGRGALRGVFPVLFMVGALVGLLFEGLNLYWLHAWTFSDRPLLGIRRPIDKAAFLGVAWGFAPLSTVFLAKILAGGPLLAASVA
ncbi:MAG: hypothetical protein KGL69_08640 [Alphaproteobacteria bacterium]|nr:hypothetical protein [Alphaproteobacteria bacterium]